MQVGQKSPKRIVLVNARVGRRLQRQNFGGSDIKQWCTKSVSLSIFLFYLFVFSFYLELFSPNRPPYSLAKSSKTPSPLTYECYNILAGARYQSIRRT